MLNFRFDILHLSHLMCINIYIYTISTSKWNKIHASYLMYIYIYLHIHKCISKYSQSAQQVQTCQLNTNFSWQKSFTRPVHRSPSHQLAFSADLVGSTHLWGHLSRFKHGWEQAVSGPGSVNHNQTMEEMQGKSSPSGTVSNSDRISPCCRRFGFTFPTDTHQSTKQRLAFLHHSLPA